MKHIEVIEGVYDLGWAYSAALKKAIGDKFDVLVDLACRNLGDKKSHMFVQTRDRRRFRKEEIEAIKNFVEGWNTAIELENF